MSRKQIALAVLLVILIIVMVAAIIVDRKFALIVASPRISHESLVKPETRAQIVLDVPKAKEIIKKKLLAGTSVPDWVLPRALPYDAALVVNLDYSRNNMDLTLFVNDQRLAPILVDQINSLKLPPPFDKWFKEKMAWKERGRMVRNGAAPMNPVFLSKLKALFRDKPGAGAPLRIEGGHLVEAVLDNRDGSLLAIVGTIAEAEGQSMTESTTEGFLGMAVPLDVVRLQADLADEKTLKIHLVIECAPETEAADVQVLAIGLELGLPEVQQSLSKNGITLTGKSSVKDNVITGDYTIPNFDGVLAKL